MREGGRADGDGHANERGRKTRDFPRKLVYLCVCVCVCVRKDDSSEGGGTFSPPWFGWVLVGAFRLLLTCPAGCIRRLNYFQVRTLSPLVPHGIKRCRAF